MDALFAELASVARLAQAQRYLSARDLEDILHLITISSEFRARLEQPLAQAPSHNGQELSLAQPPTIPDSPGAFPAHGAPPYHQHRYTAPHEHEPHRRSLYDRVPTASANVTGCHGHPPHIPPFASPEHTHCFRDDMGAPYPKPHAHAAIRGNRRLDSRPSKSWKDLLRLLPGVAKAEALAMPMTSLLYPGGRSV